MANLSIEDIEAVNPAKKKKATPRKKTKRSKSMTEDEVRKMLDSRLAEFEDLKKENERLKKELEQRKVESHGAVASTKMGDYTSAAKMGAIKATFDKIVDSISSPVADTIVETLKAKNPVIATAGDKVIRVGISIAFMLGIAEVFKLVSGFGEIPGVQDGQRKAELLSAWIRTYAAERFGEQLVESAWELLPKIMGSFEGIDLSVLEETVGDLVPKEKQQEEELITL